MIDNLNSYLEQLVGLLWGLPTVMLLIGGGVFFCILLRGIPITGFAHAIQVVRGKYDSPDDPGEINHFKALCTALSATVGLGNIAGVAVAIKLGGPGATFWMIVAGIVGMATKYAECTLAVKYRKVDERGVVHGGPMHYISQALKGDGSPLPDFFVSFLANLFAICCILAAIGAANMFQVNQVAVSLETSFGVSYNITGIVMMLLVGVVILGGIQRIANVASTLVPLMGGLYVIGCLLVILLNIGAIPGVVAEIVTSAFSGAAAAGGFTGAVFRTVLIQGVRRAAFSSEAGMGSAAIAHSAAKTSEPVREGSVALLEPFIDTVVICTMTALVINVTGVWTGEANGVALTQLALDTSLPGFGTYFIPVAVSMFAFSTIISWYYYGERSIDFLVGEKGILPFKLVFSVATLVGAQWKIIPILNFSDSAMALMIIPNMIALFFLSKTIKHETDTYFNKLRAGEFKVAE